MNQIWVALYNDQNEGETVVIAAGIRLDWVKEQMYETIRSWIEEDDGVSDAGWSTDLDDYDNANSLEILSSALDRVWVIDTADLNLKSK